MKRIEQIASQYLSDIALAIQDGYNAETWETVAEYVDGLTMAPYSLTDWLEETGYTFATYEEENKVVAMLQKLHNAIYDVFAGL